LAGHHTPAAHTQPAFVHPMCSYLWTSAPVGCVLTVRLIGVIEAKQRRKGEPGSGTIAFSRLPRTRIRTPISKLSTGSDPTCLTKSRRFIETYTALKMVGFPHGTAGDGDDRQGNGVCRGDTTDLFRQRSADSLASPASLKARGCRPVTTAIHFGCAVARAAASLLHAAASAQSENARSRLCQRPRPHRSYHPLAA
jgi:hypothetical protein